MATIKILSVKPEIYRGGWDVTVELSNMAKTENVTFYWPRKEKPDDRILAGKFQYLGTQFDAPEPVQEKTYAQSEVDRILIDKKYFIAGQHFPIDLSVQIGVK